MNDKPFKEDFDIMSCLIESEGDSELGWRKLVFQIPRNMCPNFETFDTNKYEITVEQQPEWDYRLLTIKKQYQFLDHLDNMSTTQMSETSL